MERLRLPSGAEHSLDPKQGTTIGSGPDAVLRVDDSSVSEVHCVIRALQGGGFGLKDLGSEHGTFIDGRRIEAVRLEHGLRVRLGASFDFVYLARDDAPAQPTPPAPAAEETAPRRAAKAAAPSKTAEDTDLEVGARLGGYEIEGVVGRGGMGTVYRGTQLSLSRQVALKVLKSELAADPAFVERFISEARAAGRFNHPNVVQVFDVAEEDGRPFYSMELLPDGSLEDELKRSGPMSLDRALQALRDAAAGLGYAKQLGLVHRDIKPDNLMPSDQGRLKICDLGLATDPGGGSREGKILGTPHFLSPEQAQNKTVTHKSDIYSLGCSTYRLLTAKNPYPRKTVREILRAHIDAEVPRVVDVRADCPEAFDALIARMMAKDADARPDADELVAEIDAMLETSSPSRGPLIAIVAVLLVTVIGGAIFIATRDDKPREIIKVDPDANKALAKDAEKTARIAFLEVGTLKGDAPLLEQAAAYEKVASAHAGTEAAKSAGAKARELRDKAAKQAAARKQAEAKLAARMRRVDDLGKRASSDPVGAWKDLEKLAGASSKGSDFAKAIAKTKRAVSEQWQARAAAAVDNFREAAGAASSDVDALLKELVQELELPESGVPEEVAATFRAKLAEARAFGQTLRDERSAATRARAGEVLRARDDVLFGANGVLALVAKGELPAAAAKLREAPEIPPDLQALGAPVLELGTWLADAQAAMQELQSKLSASQPRVQLRGSEHRVRSMSANGVLILRGPDDQDTTIALHDEPEVQRQILLPSAGSAGPLKLDASQRKRAGLFLLFAVAQAVPVARGLVADGKAPAAEQATSVPVLRGLLQCTKLPQGDSYRDEALGLHAFARLVRALQNKAEVVAASWAARLEEDAPNSLIGHALGVRSPG